MLPPAAEFEPAASCAVMTTPAEAPNIQLLLTNTKIFRYSYNHYATSQIHYTQYCNNDDVSLLDTHKS